LLSDIPPDTLAPGAVKSIRSVRPSPIRSPGVLVNATNGERDAGGVGLVGDPWQPLTTDTATAMVKVRANRFVQRSCRYSRNTAACENLPRTSPAISIIHRRALEGYTEEIPGGERRSLGWLRQDSSDFVNCLTLLRIGAGAATAAGASGAALPPDYPRERRSFAEGWSPAVTAGDYSGVI
jgi:hypothetical protein